MPGTYSQILLHAVFSTKERRPWIEPDVPDRLYPYIGGIVRTEKGSLYSVGGTADHIHLYFRWRTDRAVADLMRAVKAGSSKWVHENCPKLGAFAWQEGYGVFSVVSLCGLDYWANTPLRTEAGRSSSSVEWAWTFPSTVRMTLPMFSRRCRMAWAASASVMGRVL